MRARSKKRARSELLRRLQKHFKGDPGRNPVEGLSDDADLLFVLTTNRPDVLEPALAARPDRIDQAFEVPLPDADCRSRLLTLYGQGLSLQLRNRDRLLQRTEGESGAITQSLLGTKLGKKESKGESS